MTDSRPDASIDPLGPIVESFLDRFRKGERPALDEYLARHPDLAVELRELIPALVELEAAGVVRNLSATGAYESRLSAGVSPTLPERLGDYRILRIIGEGGMGIVYEAENVTLQSRVALKVMHARFRADNTYLRRFHVEARSAARLHHTNIVPVFDYGEQNGVCYYAMPFIFSQGLDRVLDDVRRLRDPSVPRIGEACSTVAGALVGTLAHGLMTGRFQAEPIGDSSPALGATEPHATTTTASVESPDTQPLERASSAAGSSASLARSAMARYEREAARIVAQVADALAYAHNRGVLHRDIKPSNLLLDARANAWVTDFGLAKLVKGEDISRTQDLVGTLRYMAPERFRGVSDRRGDLYSLGATLYEMLTLRPVFSETDQLRLIDQIVHEPPIPPRQLARHVPRDLETIVLKCLAKDPNDRFLTAETLRDELQRFVENRPIQSRPVPVYERYWRWCKRNPSLAAANAIVAGLTIAIALILSFAAVRLRNERDAVRIEQRKTLGQLQRAVRAEREQKAELGRSYLMQAKATRTSRRPGQRFDALEALDKAVQIARERRAPVEDFAAMRDEAIAALALPDLRVARRFGRLPKGSLTYWDVSPNFDVYALTNWNGMTVIRRVADDSEVCRFPGADGWGPTSVCFGPDGRTAAVTSNGRIRLWRVDRPEPVLLVEQNAGYWLNPHSAFSPDGRWLLAETLAGDLRRIDCATGQSAKLPRSAAVIGRAAIHPDGQTLAVTLAGAARGRDRVEIRTLEDPRQSAALDLPTKVEDVAWSPDGKRVALAGTDRKVYIWDLGESKPLALAASADGGLVLTFNHRGDVLACIGWGGCLSLWDARTGRVLLSRSETTGARPRFSTDDRFIGCGFAESRGPDGASVELQIFEFASGPEFQTVGNLAREDRPTKLAVSPDGRMLAIGMRKRVGLWDLNHRAPLGELPVGWSSVGFDASDSLLTYSQAGLLRWTVGNDQAEVSADNDRLHVGPPEVLMTGVAGGQLSSSRDGRVAAGSAHDEGAFGVLDGPSRRRIHLGPQRDVRHVAVSPDGRWAATSTFGARNAGTSVWEISTRRRVTSLPASGFSTVLFSPDGRWLATASVGCEIWSVGSWRLERTIGSEGPYLAFTPDSRLLALSSKTGVNLYESSTGSRLATFEDPDLVGPNWLAFNPDGSRLVTCGGETRAAAIWDLRLIRQQLAAMGLDWDQPPYPSTPDSPPPPLPRAEVDLGPLRDHTEQFTTAAETLLSRYSALLKSQPDNAEAFHQRGHALFRLNREAEAAADWEASLRLKPDQPELPPQLAEFYNNRAWTLVAGPVSTRDPSSGLVLSRRAVELAPGQALYLNTLGVALYRAARYAEAAPVLERSLAAGKGEADASDLFFLAMAHHRLRAAAAARADYDRAVRWLDAHPNLDARRLAELNALREEALGVLAGSADELPPDVFASGEK
jgi:eukaryotic-like serine/threonine-protein kinase